jgi:hypothetical protein
MVQHVSGAHMTAADVANLSQLFGYKCFLFTAAFALRAFVRMVREEVPMTVQQQSDALSFISEAADLMAQPRIGSNAFTLGAESQFVDELRTTANNPVLSAEARAHLVPPLQRLEVSGALQQRHIERFIAETRSCSAANASAVAAAAAAPGLRACGLATCDAREAHPSHFKRCAACRRAAYCCKEHQTEDWPSHKAACKAARKAAEKTAE